LTSTGRLLNLVITGKESKERHEKAIEIEVVLKKWKVDKKI